MATEWTKINTEKNLMDVRLELESLPQNNNEGRELGCRGLSAGRNTFINNPLQMLAMEEREGNIKTLFFFNVHSQNIPFFKITTQYTHR